jgi:hypothetical protein
LFVPPSPNPCITLTSVFGLQPANRKDFQSGCYPFNQ